MAHGEERVGLRKRLVDAVKVGFLDPKESEVLQLVLIEIMNDAERKKQQCDASIKAYHAKIASAEGQKHGYSAISSIVFNIINQHVTKAEAEAADRASRQGEEDQKAAYEQRLRDQRAQANADDEARLVAEARAEAGAGTGTKAGTKAGASEEGASEEGAKAEDAEPKKDE